MWRSLCAVVAIACSASPTPVSNRQPAPATTSDIDGDGIPDVRDRCPRGTEDYDLYQDDDGCPDPDNDGDGALDDSDDCPYEPGRHTGCVRACRVFVQSNDDCFGDPTVYYNERDVPSPQRIAEIVRIARDNPSVQAITVMGQRAKLVANPLRAQLPQLEIVEDHRDVAVPRAIWVRITKQRFGEGRFRSMECTPFGPIYRPARAGNCER